MIEPAGRSDRNGKAGSVAPYFGELGGGTQLVSPAPLDVLIKRGIVEEVVQ